MKKSFILLVCGVAFVFLAGCSVSQRTINNAEKRVESLLSKGVPDSSLSRAKVFLYQARDAKSRDDIGIARKAADSMNILIAQAEAQYKDDMNRLKPWVESKKRYIYDETAGLTGLHKRHLDSTMAVIDSFVNINWLLQAEANTQKLLNYVPKLKLDEQLAADLRPKIPGVWTCSQETKHSTDKSVHAVEKKIFQFNSDGTGSLIEKKSGKSSPIFKEDWEFYSTGKYDIKGDTIALFVDRFKVVRQDIWEKKEKDGREEWVKRSDPTYDSAITDHSQDRFITYGDLTQDFVK